ncbi:MAG: chemotaxis protein CheW [Desulfobulbaceae bacterium A2]|nr:MAG: chemotaxis protein CheW [Desulfobulbaceae bacterium A2]
MSNEKPVEKHTLDLSTFLVGDTVCGMDILKVQEINKLMEMTTVPQAPDYVRGILNLRGQIVTVIDLAKKLGLGETEMQPEARNIIVNSPGEHVGLLVRKISDVVPVDPDKIEPPPANMRGIQGQFFSGIYKTDKSLIAILDVDEILRIANKN